MKKNINTFLGILIVSFGLVVLGWNCTSANNEQTESAKVQHSSKTEEYYTCPMHPSVHKTQPGSCPVCGMTLVKKIEEEENENNSRGDNAMKEITLSPSKQILANISTSKAERMKLQSKIRAVGTTAYAESNFRTISMRFAGRVEKLYITYTGQKIKRGDAVADVYSPEMIAAQKEYVLALNSYEEVQQRGLDLSDAASLLQQSKQKLLLWGCTEEQITQLQQTKQTTDVITIYSPVAGTVLKKNAAPQQYVNTGETLYDVADLSTLWMNINVYENEIQFVQVGQEVETETRSYPGKIFSGKIIFVSPSIDASSRTLQVRVELPNHDEQLKLEMYLNVRITINVPEAVVVPASAILSTGNRSIVWVRKNEKTFEPRIVTLGEKAEGYVQILTGITEGETVVTSGGYLLDSESQLQVGINTK